MFCLPWNACSIDEQLQSLISPNYLAGAFKKIHEEGSGDLVISSTALLSDLSLVT